MFVAWQFERTRAVRRIFLAVCLLPCALLTGWAVWRHAPAHRDAIARSLESALGTGLSIGRVEHLRPGCVRLGDMRVLDDRGRLVLHLDAAELEWSTGEVRFRTSVLDVTPATTAIAARAARRWLAEPRRFPRDVVVEVGRLRPASGDAAPGAPAFGLRAECVAAPTGRAVRVRGQPESGDGLVVQVLAGVDGAAPRVEARGVAVGALPIGVVAVLLDWPELPGAVGPAATFSGTVATMTEEGRVRGTFTGVLDDVDLTACTRRLPFRGEGRVRVEVERCRIEEGRLAELTAVVGGNAGAIDRRALESLAGALGARPGAAWPTAAPSVAFDRLSATVALDADGLRVGGADGGALLAREGLAILEAPSRGVPVDRLAWALAPPGSATVPATVLTGWLLSVLPLPTAVEAGQSLPAATRR